MKKYFKYLLIGFLCFIIGFLDLSAETIYKAKLSDSSSSGITIITTVYEKDKYYITLNGICPSNISCYVDESKDKVWEAGDFVIFKEDWALLKSKMPFVSNNTEEKEIMLYVTSVKTGDSLSDFKFYYSINASGKTENEEASEIVTPDDGKIDLKPSTDKDEDISSDIGTCVSYLGHADGKENGEPTVAYYLQIVFNLIKVGSIVLCIVFSMIDFSGAITSAKTDVKATAMKCVKRLIVVVIVLLLPTFIDMIGNIIGIDDILCGIK